MNVSRSTYHSLSCKVRKLQTTLPLPLNRGRNHDLQQAIFWLMDRTCRPMVAIRWTRRQKFKAKLRDNSHLMTDTTKHKQKYGKRHKYNLSPRQIMLATYYKLKQKTTKPFHKILKNNNKKSLNFKIRRSPMMHLRWTLRDIFTLISSNLIYSRNKMAKWANLWLCLPRSKTKTMLDNAKNLHHKWTKPI